MARAPSTQLDECFTALSDATRRRILERLAEGDASVSELATPFAISLPAVSKHLRVLERAGLLVQTKEGRVRRCHLVAEPMRDAREWIDQYREFWEGRFDALARYLEGSRKERRGHDEQGEGGRPGAED
jgi:DNA-binding transcriptional ArsR family regulator